MYSKFPGFYPHHVNFLRKYLFVYHTGFKGHNLTVNYNMSCHSLAQILAVNQQRKYNSIHKPQYFFFFDIPTYESFPKR